MSQDGEPPSDLSGRYGAGRRIRRSGRASRPAGSTDYGKFDDTNPVVCVSLNLAHRSPAATPCDRSDARGQQPSSSTPLASMRQARRFSAGKSLDRASHHRLDETGDVHPSSIRQPHPIGQPAYDSKALVIINLTIGPPYGPETAEQQPARVIGCPERFDPAQRPTACEKRYP